MLWHFHESTSRRRYVAQQAGIWWGFSNALYQIIAAPEVNQVLPELPILGDLIKNLYDCHYDKFFIALGMTPDL